jgi:hypothetical protein
LAQLGLAFFVDDGMLVITSDNSAEAALPPSMSEPSPLMQKLQKAERGELNSKEMQELVAILQTRRELRKVLDESVPDHSGSPISGTFGGPGPGNQAKPDHEELESLVKAVRELVEVLKSERQTKKATESK